MRSKVLLITRVAFLGTLMSGLAVTAINAQQSAAKKPPTQVDDVVRITTELVQTDLTVLDKQGRFVEGLRPEQFELTLEGKPQAISFFEFIKTGSAREAAQLRGAGGARLGSQPVSAKAEGDQRRVIFFFLDDLHLSGASPDIEIQARVYRNDIAIAVLPAAKLPTDTTADQTRLPYWAEIALDKLAVGRYVLQVTATDRETKATAMQQASFVVE